MKSNLVKITAQVDVTEPAQVQALKVFLGALNLKTSPGAKQIPVVGPTLVKEEEAKTPKTVEAAEKTPEIVDEQNEVEPTVKKEEIQTLISQKVGKHRDTIKAELTRLGANNVSSLGKEHYDLFFEFLKALA